MKFKLDSISNHSNTYGLTSIHEHPNKPLWEQFLRYITLCPGVESPSYGSVESLCQDPDSSNRLFGITQGEGTPTLLGGFHLEALMRLSGPPRRAKRGRRGGLGPSPGQPQGRLAPGLRGARPGGSATAATNLYI